MTRPGAVLSTADLRRPRVAAAALGEFAAGGYHGTTVATVAQAAKISPAYVFKLYPRKEALFVAALETCFDEILAAIEAGADAAGDESPDAVLDAMGQAYASLLRDRRLLRMQVHAQSAADIPEIGDALRSGLQRVTLFAKERSRADDDAIQRFVAYGQLCHLIVATGIDEIPAAWADILAHGIRHPD
ncbi:TetR/AcrR family transcriptional regulator [Microbacterium sp. RD1]|uniref:TetR/AcrR family transcriptional regulator n=1 Tax=Microbacterium sp. RD1 TaxID=3457313 RepID=UPI003FA59DEB